MKTSEQPLVSIVIVTYNQALFIEEAIDSALSQSYPNIEILVSDDASTDGTSELAKKYATMYPEKVIALTEGPNLGITGNCNRGLNRCRGKYAVFMGGDDVLLPEKVEAQVSWLEQDEASVLCGHRLEVFYDDVNQLPHPLDIAYPSGNGADWLIKNGCPYGALSIMVRCSAFPTGGFNSRLKYASDHLFWIECLLNGGEYGYIDAVLGRYRRHSNNITNQSEVCLADIEEMFNYLEQAYPQYIKLIIQGRINLLDCPRGGWMIKNGKVLRGLFLLFKVFVNSPGRLFLSLNKYTLNRKQKTKFHEKN